VLGPYEGTVRVARRVFQGLLASGSARTDPNDPRTPGRTCGPPVTPIRPGATGTHRLQRVVTRRYAAAVAFLASSTWGTRGRNSGSVILA
jgi:hypothetical protein